MPVQFAITVTLDLRDGIGHADERDRPITYRYIRPGDDVAAITAMLHEAYAPLAAQGMRFLATHQDADTTRRRMSGGLTILALDDDTIVGTVTTHLEPAPHPPFYRRPGVARFSQFAVRPSHQRNGIGSTLLRLVEAIVVESGATVLALDTSERAAHLIALYQAKGYEFVEHVRWPDVNYRSAILAKDLS